MIRPISLDLSINNSYNVLNELLEKEHATIKILINNAGFEKTGHFKQMKTTDILAIIDLNIKGFSMINRICIPYMIKGSIGIMTCSISSFCPVPSQAVYSASKAYVRFLSRAIAQECKNEGIHILAMCPGNMDTEMNPKGGSSQSAQVDKLPFLDMEIITKRSIVLAKKGRTVYTPGVFYKMYGLVSKLFPTSWMLKIVGRAYL